MIRIKRVRQWEDVLPGFNNAAIVVLVRRGGCHIFVDTMKVSGQQRYQIEQAFGGKDCSTFRSIDEISVLVDYHLPRVSSKYARTQLEKLFPQV